MYMELSPNTSAASSICRTQFRQAAVKVCFPFVQLCAHWIGVVRARIAEHEYMDWRMAEVHTGIHAAALAARHLLDFDLVAHLSFEDLHGLFPDLQVSYDKEFPRLRVSRRGSPSRRFQDLFNKFIPGLACPSEIRCECYSASEAPPERRQSTRRDMGLEVREASQRP